MDERDSVGTTQCHLCKGTGISMQQRGVVELSSANGGTGLVHVTCSRCGGVGHFPGFHTPV